jgi:hypothetical protein
MIPDDWPFRLPQIQGGFRTMTGIEEGTRLAIAQLFTAMKDNPN